jgi:hypothetical protein
VDSCEWEVANRHAAVSRVSLTTAEPTPPPPFAPTFLVITVGAVKGWNSSGRLSQFSAMYTGDDDVREVLDPPPPGSNLTTRCTVRLRATVW